MSAQELPELRALHELTTLVGHLSEELAAFRRRALTAETRVKELETPATAGATERTSRDRIKTLERENSELRDRLDKATTRTQQMLDRVRFLRQQAQAGGAGGGDR